MIEVKKTEIECEYGIFEYLTKESNGNPYTCKAIDVTTTSVNGGKIYNLFDQSQKNWISIIWSTKRLYSNWF